ncbi:Cof-type HAD-IIB family hydrolase [Paenibacillus sp. 1P07SE]|uniref:Cof-type HAD-IIB family hydrolase n=1 Tax=Paenibacillus sp. 1P07SE TaxID=3132209 RepID=UPI0039A5B96E
MNKYKLIALDMDGTLLNDRSEISEENAKWIHKALDAGVTVIFSTGRGFRSALPFAEQLELTTPMVTINGGEIWHRPHVLHKRTYLAESIVGKLRELADTHGAWYWAYAVEDIYNAERWLEPGEQISDKHWLKFGFDTPDDEARAAIRREIEGWGGLEITNSSTTNLEINPEGVSKAGGVREVCGMLGIEMSEVIAVGDSLNDLSVIQEVGLGIAMGNAQERVKAAADAVTVTNNEDAIARVIEDYIFKGK